LGISESARMSSTSRLKRSAATWSGGVAALSALKRGSILLVVRRDRLARDTLTAAIAERLAKKAGATIHSVSGNNGNGPEDQLMRQVVDAFAQYERALISMRTKAALKHKQSKGEKTGGDVPYGWKLSRDGIHLDVDAEEQATIFAARALREQGLSLRSIALKLSEQGRFPRKGKAWHPETIKHLLSSKALEWPEAARS
jgi:site-specific DNA recombinase